MSQRRRLEITPEEKCYQDYLYSLESHQMTLAGLSIGGLLQMFAPKHWKANLRSIPFMAFGISGILADGYRQMNVCGNSSKKTWMKFKKQYGLSPSGNEIQRINEK
jgi:hypothetical protein